MPLALKRGCWRVAGRKPSHGITGVRMRAHSTRTSLACVNLSLRSPILSVATTLEEASSAEPARYRRLESLAFFCILAVASGLYRDP